MGSICKLIIYLEEDLLKPAGNSPFKHICYGSKNRAGVQVNSF